MRRVLVRVWMLVLPMCGSTTTFSSRRRDLRPALEYVQRRTAPFLPMNCSPKAVVS